MVLLQVLNLKKEEEDKRKLEMEVEMLQHEFDRRHGDGAKLEDGHPKQSGSGQSPERLQNGHVACFSGIVLPDERIPAGSHGSLSLSCIPFLCWLPAFFMTPGKKDKQHACRRIGPA